jgi:hypothetical protein
MPRQLLSLIVCVLLTSAVTAAASAENFLEITFDTYEGPGGAHLYDVFAVGANKDGATTCELVTPSGTYAMSDVGGGFMPGQSFDDEHTGLSFAEFAAAIEGGWTLNWDVDETVVTIDFGTVLQDDFWPVPTISAPLDGAPIQLPGDPNPPTIEWTYETSACEAQLDYVTVNLFEESGAEVQSGELEDCSTLSWSPSEPLAEGTWLIRVENVNAGARDVPDGLDIVGDPWVLENEGWLSYRSIDSSHNAVVLAETTSWGGIKTLYRR